MTETQAIPTLRLENLDVEYRVRGQGRKVERAVRDILVSLARVGEISAMDEGRRFTRRMIAAG